MGVERVSDYRVDERIVHDREWWLVFDQYVISGENIVLSDVATVKAYIPFLERSLLGEFARIKPSKDHKILLKFVHRYGLPGLTRPENGQVRNLASDKISLIYEEAQAFRQALKMWEIIHWKDPSEAKCMLDDLRKVMNVPKIGDKYSSGFTVENELDILAGLLSQMIDWGISTESLEMVPGFTVRKTDRGYDFYHTWNGKSLASIAWMQFAFIVMEERHVKRCLECNNYFVQTRSNQKFCPGSRKGGKRSTCENNHTKREARKNPKP